MSSWKQRRSGLFTLGAALLPEDFPERLTVLKEAGGLSWEGMAVCLGVDNRQVLRWGHGAVPCGQTALERLRSPTKRHVSVSSPEVRI